MTRGPGPATHLPRLAHLSSKPGFRGTLTVLPCPPPHLRVTVVTPAPGMGVGCECPGCSPAKAPYVGHPWSPGPGGHQVSLRTLLSTQERVWAALQAPAWAP